MVKYLVCLCFVAIAATAINGNLIQSGSTNTGTNVLSSGSNVVQNDVQNVNDHYGYGPYYAGYPGYVDYAAPVGLPVPVGLPAPVDLPPPALRYPLPHVPLPHHLGYPYDAPIYVGHPVLGGYGPGYANIVSGSTNTGSNIMSTDSNVYQGHVQNVDSRY